ncbi:cytochrome P450 [Xylariomycetidae sp. FL2044]|nr:cytochrome P450 [Xylariomycetidae sp. FL2044]
MVEGLAATYLFLRSLLYLTQDAREPPAIEIASRLSSTFWEGKNLTTLHRDKHHLPIYTLHLPFSRVYVVNSTDRIPAIQKQWRTVSFGAIATGAGRFVGMSKEGVDLMHKDLTSEHGFTLSWPRLIASALGIFSHEVGKFRREAALRVGLWRWGRDVMVAATTEAIWGTQNPYRDVDVAEAYRKRLRWSTTMIDYVRKGGHEKASGLVRVRHEHHRQRLGLSLEDFARGELGNTFAILSDILREISALVFRASESFKYINLAGIRESCPVLLSTLQETLRFRSVGPGIRLVLEDVLSQDRTLLKKGKTSQPGYVSSFGGGHLLCPGPHFGTTEILALAACLVLQFDMASVAGRIPPIPDHDIEVELHPRDTDIRWEMTLSGSDKAIEIVSEDVTRRD